MVAVLFIVFLVALAIGVPVAFSLGPVSYTHLTLPTTAYV